MKSNRLICAAVGTGIGALLMVVLTGCEGWNRKHDQTIVDITPPPEDADYSGGSGTVEVANIADMVEQMMQTRQAYLQEVRRLEGAYLEAGDTVKANWARRVRLQLEEILNYPWLTAAPVEHRADVAPVESIPEADSLYNEAYSIYRKVSAIPLAGALEGNKEKAREALVMFKRLLHDYPTSDKVDDAAFFCGEIYKEYLREEDPDDELSVRYYQWAAALDPNTPHAARFQAAVVYDFRRHDRTRALELYHQVLDREEADNLSNVRFAATRIEQLTDEEFSHIRPDYPPTATVSDEPRTAGDEPRDPPPREP